MKEAWLFGKLQTVGVSEAENRAEEAARKVAEHLSNIQSNGKPQAQNGSNIKVEEAKTGTEGDSDIDSKDALES